MSLLWIRKTSAIAALSLAILVSPWAAFAQDEAEGESSEELSPIDQLPWVMGKGKSCELGRQADVVLPAGFRFVGGKNAKKCSKMLGNITNGSEIGIVQKIGHGYVIYFDWNDCGFVADDEKDELDADEILEGLQDGAKAANKIRRKRGMAEMDIVGWYQAPEYDPETNQLCWATLLESEGEQWINYKTCRLGRHGVVDIVLAGDPETMDADVADLNELLKGFEFKKGSQYGDFQEGDKIAEYGLYGLIAGGAIAAGIKTGLFGFLIAKAGKFFKLIIAGIVAIGAFIAKLFGFKKKSNA